MIENFYFTRGTVEVDGTLGAFAFQGLEAFCHTKVDGQWVSCPMDENGNPSFGYLAKEVSFDEYTKWKDRIANATVDGYADSEGVWYPSNLGPGRGVINKTAWDSMVAYKNSRNTQRLSITRAQALVTLAQNGVTKDGIYAALDTLPNAAIARVWFDESATFNRSNAYVKAMVTALGMTEEQADTLFIEASKL